jgi:hypothetical protein
MYRVQQKPGMQQQLVLPEHAHAAPPAAQLSSPAQYPIVGCT